MTLEKGGIGLCGWMESRTPEEGGIGPWVDAVGSLRGGCIEGRQKKVASVRAGTPSGDTTRAP